MGFTWTPESINWFEQAADQTGFYHLISRELVDLLPTDVVVYDLGCGTGYLSMEVAGWAKQVTALDWSKDAIRFLQQKAKTKRIGNIDTLLKDWRAWNPPAQADLVCLSYCSGLLDHMDQLLDMTRAYLAVILPYENSGTRRSEQRETVERVVPFLMEKKIPFEMKTIQCEFGQPLETLEDCRNFLRHYSGTPDEKLGDDVLTRYYSQRLECYYIPKIRRSCLVIINKQNIHGLGV